MELRSTPIAGVVQAETKSVSDTRGRFARLFCAEELSAVQQGRAIVQINLSVTHRVGAIRGLHFQYPPHAEAKWVRCLQGRIFDVVVDLRRDSPTFLSWYGCQLDGSQQNALFIPEGCAHGFQVLIPDSEVLYLHTAYYTPSAEGGVRYNDPRVGIAWPLLVSDVSDRDRRHPLLDITFTGLDR